MYSNPSADKNPVLNVRAMLKELLVKQRVDAVLVLAKNPWSDLPMPTLIADPTRMDDADPLAPAAPVSSARQASALTRNPTGKTVALVLRPCEIRALVELVKLNQCGLENTVIIGMDCLGRMENRTFIDCAAAHSDLSERFLTDAGLQGKITDTCASCADFIPENTDITLCTLGAEPGHLGFEARTDKGKELLDSLGFTSGTELKNRESAITAIREKRSESKTQRFDHTTGQLNTVDGFQTFIARCLNCYNCRTACPVCYCKECVFLTDVFAHPPELLLERAARRGAVKMPTDTSMFHLTRLSHIGHACVGCGQCSSVCPSDISVADMFRTVSEKTQAFFNYQPGRDVNDPIPQLVVRPANRRED